ncbi:MAG: YcgN family cysteine cluster protein [Anaerolineaceae bacterium]|nr:YcgN family cysteine cluster protein [Anaerolineaceae bacterium]
MTIEKDFWKHTPLAEMSLEEWEALCDGCGICCLYKIEDKENMEVHLTNVACRFLDLETCICQLYDQRKSAMPTCIKMTPSKVESLTWLPETCAYRLILKGRPLPDWHPLVSGDPNSVHRAGISVSGKVISESSINMDNLEEYVIEDLYSQEPFPE